MESAHAAVETVAERFSALGEVPDGRAATVAVGTPFEPFPDGTVADGPAVALIGIEATFEKRTWMLRV